MAAGKKNKLRKMLSPPATSPPPPSVHPEDDDLMDDLFSQLDSKDQNVQAESAAVLTEMQVHQPATAKKDSKSRHKARQVRKAAAIADHFSPTDADADARIERETAEEKRIIHRTCDDLGLQIHEINPDGHCLFSAIADQLNILGILPDAAANYTTVRRAAADYIFAHPDDFVPFLPSSTGEDGTGATSSGLMTPSEFDAYCRTIRDTGTWGGEPEIMALSRAYRVPIHVIQGGKPPIVEHNPVDGAPASSHIVHISYHRRMYGLGEHYNSLRPKTGIANTIKSMLHSNT
ncbi:hypothetical protein EUX98_g2074 [Antrodiella citrinella]|uniref:OTU domain-containing protein n=1 Tax=Antrodiella citrinella TaxID=2447956 RepID=A0A4S4N1G9_9APHY|nr:hypothetical protein EUX98_g2074 [Antrodiella citrinella]